ncbi:MAG: DUF1836 domain-containing protein [Bacteroidales bacterium]|nr:DUF1836 domain-containing protein [Lachnoclostridium sp.]MCM1383658.1 DUF1836 domain-containing protein [Lachnoclostridium sp.]MCM1466288.1 DUF1836 domain-containing protein [Bacteroidales bacterium]
MTIDAKDLLNSILESLDRIDYIKPEDIPNIDLYMDQVTTFMDGRLRATARCPGDDKILTKTMINNYAKNDLLPPPIKKKYSREHVLVLIFIYYFKSFLSINDIQNLLRPITEKFFKNNEDFNLEDVYREVFSLEPETLEDMKADIRRKFERAEGTFADAPEDDRETLKKFAFICELSVDVYVKKLIIEKMLDECYGGQKAADKNAEKPKNVK